MKGNARARPRITASWTGSVVLMTTLGGSRWPEVEAPTKRQADCVRRENRAKDRKQGRWTAGRGSDQVGKRLGDGAESNGDGESGSIVVYRKLLQAIRHCDGALVGVEIVLETKKVAHDAD